MSKLLSCAGKAEIRFPEEMFPIEGFYKVHDNPCVRILCLDKGERVVIAAFELVMLPDDLLHLCKERIAGCLNTTPDKVWIHVTHAITTPHSPGGPLIGPGGEIRPIPKEFAHMNISIPRILEQRELYFPAILNAVEEACKDLVPVESKIGIGKGICDINCNRDMETPFGWWVGKGSDGYSNKEMTVLRLENAEGAPVAAVVSYGIKPCVIDNSQMREGNRQVSADLTGVACRELEEKWNCPVLFLMSAAGNQIPCKSVLYDEVLPDGTVKPTDLGVELGLRYAEELGQQMAEDVLRIGEMISCGDMNGDVQSRNSGFEWEGKARSRVQPTREAAYSAERMMKVPVYTMCLGDEIALVATRPELNAITEKQLQEASPMQTTLLVSMVDGGMKYMPDQKSFDKVTWEAQNSMFMPGAAEAFVAHAAGLLKEDHR